MNDDCVEESPPDFPAPAGGPRRQEHKQSYGEGDEQDRSVPSFQWYPSVVEMPLGKVRQASQVGIHQV